MTTKTFKLYWIFDAANHDDMMTQGYVGCTTQSIKKRLHAHTHSKNSGQTGTTSNTKRHMLEFIKNCEDVQVTEICRTNDEEMAAKIELLLRPTPGIGANKHKGGKRNGVQRAIICITEEGFRIDYPSMSKASADGFHLGGVQSCLNGSSKYTSHAEYGKCTFIFA